MSMAVAEHVRDLAGLTLGGVALEAEHVGVMRPSGEIASQVQSLRQRMDDDGYLYLPGLLDVEQVLAARREVTRRLFEAGHLHPDRDPMDAVAHPTTKLKFMPEITRDNAALLKVVYDGPLMRLFERLLGGAVRHFDYTWFRAVCPGPATPIHCDSVYMNRGTQNLYTAWVPYGDAPLDMGGLILLEKSYKNRRLRETYGQSDVDAFCVNKTGPAAHDAWEKHTDGHLGKDPNLIRRSVTREGNPDSQWRTADYRAGDVVIFSIFTLHGGTDNHSDRFRLSSDTRYQLAGEPADERWIGANPPAHGKLGKRGMVC
jgi:hypothetical protein